MSVKAITRIKFFLMIIIPILAIEAVAWMEYIFIIQPEIASFIYPGLFVALAISIIRYKRRCRKCGTWNSVKEVSREEINRMEHPQEESKRKGAKRRAFQVRICITKQCRHCGHERPYEVIKEVKE